jgi:hypothetical protein
MKQQSNALGKLNLAAIRVTRPVPRFGELRSSLKLRCLQRDEHTDRLIGDQPINDDADVARLIL